VRLAAFSLLALAGCSRVLDAFEGDPPADRSASPVVRSADGAMSASAKVHFRKGHTGAHSSTSDEVAHWLEVERNGATERVLLGRWLLQTGSADAHRAGRRANMTLAFAPDGHAIAVSTDGGKTHQYVVLDHGAGFACGRGPAAVPPPTRDVVLGSLREFGLLRDKRTCDPQGAARVGCARVADDEFWAVLAPEIVTSRLVDSERDPLVECAQKAARERPATRAILIAALSKGPAELGAAAEALANGDAEEVQIALARDLAALAAKGESEACWALAKATWALASITARRKALPDAVRAAMLTLARGPAACPSELSGKGARVYAVAALAAVKAPELEALAATCTGEAKPWKLLYQTWNEALVNGTHQTPIGCLAKAAL